MGRLKQNRLDWIHFVVAKRWRQARARQKRVREEVRMVEKEKEK